MVTALSIRDEQDLIQKIFSRYRNNEMIHDVRDAQRKMLVLREILAEVGFDIQQLTGIQFQRLVNLLLSRMFLPSLKKNNFSGIAQSVSDDNKELLFQFSLRDLGEFTMVRAAVGDTSSKCGPDAGQVKDILKFEIN